MTSIEQFITWKEEGVNTIHAWFDHAAAHEAGLVRRSATMKSAPCFAAETICRIPTGEYSVVEAGTDHATLDEAKAAAMKSAVEFILTDYPPFAR